MDRVEAQKNLKILNENRAESETMFDQWLIKTNRMLSVEDREVF